MLSVVKVVEGGRFVVFQLGELYEPIVGWAGLAGVFFFLLVRRQTKGYSPII